MRTANDEHEVPVASYGYFADRDPLTRAVMDRMLAGVSTRKYKVVGEPVGEEVEQESSSTSKSTVSELSIERTHTALGELMARRLDDVRLAVMMLDGLEIADRTHVVALGISTEGVKIPLGLWEGSTKNATLVSLREGMTDMLTLMRLGIGGQLVKTLCSTNPCESMVRHEAPCERRERTNNSHPCWLEDRPRADAAAWRSWGQSRRGIARWRREQPRQRSGRAALPDARVRASKTERQSESKAVVEAS
jgi:hypothetical protein